MRAKVRDCPGCGGKCKDTAKTIDAGEVRQKLNELMKFFSLSGDAAKDGEEVVEERTPGIDRIRQSLADWQEEQKITQAEIDAAIPSAVPALNRILQNQIIRIKQLEMELFRLERDGENRGV
jgi:t-SNARE complex subunit (syntaxin)